MQYDPTMALPSPGPDAASHSGRVARFIAGCIDAAGGSIGFGEFMQHALYAPGLGYYAAGSTKFGEDGDFVTAPEVSPLFGRVIAGQCAQALAAMGGGVILEIGAGSGRMAVDVLAALDALDALPDRYEILEVSADLEARQRERIEAALPHLAARVTWVSGFPAIERGVVLANEVLDALPVERFVRRTDGVRQVRVVAAGEGFGVIEAPAPQRLAAAVATIERDLGAPLPEGYASEVSLGLPDWIGALGGALGTGVAFLFDYGVSRREYYAPSRGDGWLRCHFRHRAHNDPLINPGIQDITAWVDFTAVAEAAVAAGLEIGGYAAQAQFLLGAGLTEEVAALGALPAAARIALSQQVKTLTLPGEMGEHFKCMALQRGMPASPSAFMSGDRTHTL